MAISSTTSDALVLGPGNLTFGGTDLGATEGNATFTVKRKSSSPTLNGSGGALMGTVHVIEEIPSLKVKLSEFSIDMLSAMLPNATKTGDGAATPFSLSEKIGRLPASAFKDAVFVVNPGDGKALTITIKNATADMDDDMKADFGNEEDGAVEVTFVGHYDPADPTTVPYTIEKALA
jgi:hypothetical protein